MKKLLIVLSLPLILASCTNLRQVNNFSSSENIIHSNEEPSSETSSSEYISSSELSSENNSSELPSSIISSISEILPVYEVSSRYFKYLNHSLYKTNNTNFLKVDFACELPIYKIDYQFQIYKNNGDLIEKTYDGELETTINEDGFSFIYPGIDDESFNSCGYINFLELSGESHIDNQEEEYIHQVSIHKSNEEIIEDEITSGNKIEEPEITPPNNNVTLEGWYLDNNYTTRFNFVDYNIYQDIDLYPHFVLDEEAFSGDVRSTFLTSNMVIYNTSYNTNHFFTTNQATVTGSGVVVAKEDRYAYILTNNHVISVIEGYSKASYTVKDVYNSTYSASLIYHDPNYDLALLRIRVRSNKNYYVTPFADTNPEIGTYVAAVGEPNGEKNTITIGEVTEYKVVELDDANENESNVQFEVIAHSAKTDHGSSGGALLDTDLNLVGINYAGSTTNDGTFIESFSIPVEKVKEFFVTAYSYR